MQSFSDTEARASYTAHFPDGWEAEEMRSRPRIAMSPGGSSEMPVDIVSLLQHSVSAVYLHLEVSDSPLIITRACMHFCSAFATLMS